MVHLIEKLNGPSCRILPESIPWLMANGKKDEAEKVLRSAAKFNKIELPGLFSCDVYDMKYNSTCKRTS